MKKLIFGIFLFVFALAAYSQQGLDGIIVEKYYVANAADNAADNSLAVGAVTYRIFVDLKDGWQLQSIYGDPVKNQRLGFSTSSPSFYNELNFGSSLSTDVKYTDLKNGLVMLDSWISFGAAAKTKTTAPVTYYYGIPKAYDDGANPIVHSDGLVMNNDPKAGIPVSVQDGVINVATPAVVVPSTTSTLATLLGMLDGSISSNNFMTNDGAYFSSSNVVGPNTDNRILIGQFTTEGVFNFRLNVQIRRISDNLVEQYVNENPGAGQFLRTDLAQTLGMPPTPPVVSNLTVNPGTVIIGDPVNLSVNATDNVAVTKVEFFRGTTSLGVSSSSSNPYTLVWTSNALGSFSVTAVATDDEGSTATSTAVQLTVNPVPANQVPVIDAFNVPSTANTNSGVTITATAHDPDGTVTSMEYTINNGSPVTVAYGTSYNYTTPLTDAQVPVVAVAIDNRGGRSASVTKTIAVTDPAGPPYQVLSQSVSCVGSDLFYVPVITRPGAAAVANIIGFDMVMKYNTAKVRPTGVIRVDRSLIADSTWTSYALRQAGDSIIISLFLNSKAPANTFFSGTGKVLRVEFAKTAAFLPNDNVEFTVNDLFESYTHGIEPKLVKKGSFTTFAEHLFKGKLMYWADAAPIYYSGNPATSLITNITGNLGGTAVQPDMNGEFVYDINNGRRISIDRNIQDTADVMSVVNGYDAFLTQKVVLEDPAFRPTVFQIMAMDVNRDGKISAGDVSQILQRVTKKIGEFRQIWNYNDDGTKKAGMGASYDWLFADNSGLYGDPRRFGIYAYQSAQISTRYPKDDGTGYSKYRVTSWPINNLDLPVEGTNCPIIYSETYQGVMFGDVDGSYKNLGFNEKPRLKKGSLKSASENEAAEHSVTFDLSKSTYSDGYFTFPVTVNAPDAVNSLDFAMLFNESKLKFIDVVSHVQGLQSDLFYNESDKTLRYSSFSLKDYSTGHPVITVRFESKTGAPSLEDIKPVTTYLNGNKANIVVSELILRDQVEKVRIYPNPAKDFVNLVLSENAKAKILDMKGRTIRNIDNINAYENYEIDLAGLPQGTYILRISMMIGNQEFISTKKLIVKK